MTPQQQAAIDELKRRGITPPQTAQASGDRRAEAIAELKRRGLPLPAQQGGINITPAQPQMQPQQPQQSVMARSQSTLDQINQIDSRLVEKTMPEGFEVRSGENGKPYAAKVADPFAAKEATMWDDINSSPLMERAAVALQGNTAGFGDELAGLFGGRYAKQGMRDTVASAREKRPMESMLLEIGGGVPSGGVAGNAYKLASRGKSVGSALGGATAGAAYGAGEAEGGLESRLMGGTKGAIAGGLFAKGGEGVINLGSRLKGAATGQQTTGAVAKDQFGIRLTQGQATDDLDQIAFEQAAARGGRSPDATQVMRPFMDDQREAVRAAGSQLAGSQFATANEAGAFIADGLKRKAGEAQEQVSEAYNTAKGYQASLKADGVKSMPDGVMQGLPDDVKYLMEAPSDQARQSLPAASQAMDAVKRLRTEVSAMDEVGEAVVGSVDFRRIEVARQAVNTAVSGAANKADRRAAYAVKRSFDKYIDDAVDNALFEGDDAFLDAYKTARGLRAKFADDFEANKVFDKIIDAEASPEQTLEYILGATKIAPTDRVRAVVPQLKKALGGNSPEWEALQEAAMKRVMQQTERTYNPKVLRDNLDELLTGRNQTVAQELFSPEQYNRLREFRSVVERLVPPEGAVNYSGTAYEMRRQIGEEAKRIFNWPGGRIMQASIAKYLPDRDAARARSAITTGASVSPQRSILPAGYAPVAGQSGAVGAEYALPFP